MNDVAIVGAGPYGLALAAHLREAGVSHRIFGKPMQFWQSSMPAGMKLKSDGGSSDIPDPLSAFGVRQFYQGSAQPFHATQPIPYETFVRYGQAFQQRFVPNVEDTQVTRIGGGGGGFRLELATGEVVRAARVVLATGIDMFRYIPEMFHPLSGLVSHSASYGPVDHMASRTVAVIGAGASAIDVAAALADCGAKPVIVTTRTKIDFHSPPNRRRFHQKVRRPDTGIGAGWSPWFYANCPDVFRLLPDATRVRIVRRALGAAPGWFMRDRIVGRVPMMLGHAVTKTEAADGKARLALRAPDGTTTELVADHVIAATGFRVDVSRWSFLDPDVTGALRTVDGGAPILSANFETSVDGLYVIGPASASSFGPVMRFVFGANFTMSRLPPHLARASRQNRAINESVKTRPEFAAAG